MSHGALAFIDSGTDLSAAMQGTYNLPLVAISFLVASIAGYAAMLVAERVASAATPNARSAWLTLGGCAMGAGIWSMHFVGMIAFNLPVAVNYDPGITALSVVPGVLASAAALHAMSRSSIGFWRLNLAGLSMGAGIGAMHYTGMAAMIMDARMLYDPFLFVLSILVAHSVATLALYIKHVLGRRSSGAALTKLAASSIIMGCAVAGMHYTAMAAAYYFPSETVGTPGFALSPITLAVAVTVVAMIILATAIVSTVVDRRMQEVSGELFASEARNRLILEHASEGIVTIDRVGTVQAFNRAAVTIFGHPADEVIGRNVSMLMPEAVAANHDGYLRRYEESGEARVVGCRREVAALRGDGTEFPILLAVSEVGKHDDAHHVFTAIIQDLTERRRLEAQLLQAQKLESIGQLAAGIAHEINTPSQFIGDNLEFLQESFGELNGVMKKYAALAAAPEVGSTAPDLVADVREAATEADAEFLAEEIPRALAQSRDGIERVTKIVRAMKEFSHPGSTEKEKVDLNRAIESTVTVATSEWKYVADLEFDFADGMPGVLCHAAEVNQVVLILVVNAAHAIADQTGDGEAKGQITIRTRTETDWAVVEVTDNGPGIPEDVQVKIFDPFFTTKEVGRGTGQGLSIAYSVVTEKHGGTIEVDSEVGRGSTFRVRLPLNAEVIDVEE